MSRSVIERRRRRIRGHRALRPLVLCGAMLAPALLAGGLLVAELTGYDRVLRGDVAKVGPRGVVAQGGGPAVASVVAPGRDVILKPRLVPPPSPSPSPDPVQAYGGWTSPVVADVRRSAADAAPVDVPDVVRKVVPRRSEPPQVRRTPPQPARTEGGFGCPGEWRDTWLWEVCKEQERREV
ncbi:hypothetical protein J2S55_004181 [Streptosporangium brasiliense]|uniref:Uncharacterized protein n=1 Tax=Streptosporangium brasiliense TaxID=47480 RepID=A0ABT9R6P5_9ACTN|nr:hypothetical protein [Streptosporangium brasiliense]